MSEISVHVRLSQEAYEGLSLLAKHRGVPRAFEARRCLEESILGVQQRIRALDIPEISKGGYVYLIRCGNEYKIGKAKDVDKRLRSMQLPSKPELIASMFSTDPHDLERDLHRKFKSGRTHGEWFSLSVPDVAQAIQLLTGLEKK